MSRSGGSEPSKTFIFDLDGVVYVDREGVPGAGLALQTLRDAGHQILFASNNSVRTVDTVVAYIEERTGFLPERESVLTSALATATLLRPRDETCLVVGSKALAETLEDAGISVTADHARATAVVVGLDRQISYERLTAAVLAVRRGAVFYATNDDATYPMPDGQYPGAGSIVAAVERASGREPVVCGKPHAPMQDLVASRIENDEVWMVGDRPETDLALAATRGWGKILVLSGVTRSSDDVAEPHQPDVTIESIARIPELLARE